MIDYSYPTMMAEKALHDLHQAMLRRDYDSALNYALEAATQCRLTSMAIKHMAEQELNRNKK